MWDQLIFSKYHGSTDLYDTRLMVSYKSLDPNLRYCVHLDVWR